MLTIFGDQRGIFARIDEGTEAIPPRAMDARNAVAAR
jgi:hypothetical protein